MLCLASEEFDLHSNFHSQSLQSLQNLLSRKLQIQRYMYIDELCEGIDLSLHGSQWPFDAVVHALILVRMQMTLCSCTVWQDTSPSVRKSFQSKSLFSVCRF